MKSSILLVSAPDDVYIDAPRLLLVDVCKENSQLISTCLQNLDIKNQLVVYVWKYGDDDKWLFDKKLKSDLIIFDASGTDQLLIGYFASQKNSYYMGNLKSLSNVNQNVIYTLDNAIDIIHNIIKNYE